MDRRKEQPSSRKSRTLGVVQNKRHISGITVILLASVAPLEAFTTCHVSPSCAITNVNRFRLSGCLVSKTKYLSVKDKKCHRLYQSVDMDMCDTNGGNSEVSLNGSNHTGTKNAELEELNVNAREEVSQEPSNASGLVSYKKLFTFIGATIMIWLSEPLLSLVDTTVVGKFASGGAKSALKGVSPSVVQLAALGPATMLIDNFFYFTYFLSIATTNQLATASATSNTPSKIKTTSHSLGVAAALGVMITSILFFFGKPLLSFCLGNGGIVNGVDMTPEVLSAALGYVRIRGVIAPLTVMGIIAQSVSLAVLDTRTPFLAVLVASVLNTIGDLVLVAKFKMGLQGAALATAMASAISSTILLFKTKKRFNKWKADLDEESKDLSEKEDEELQTKSTPFISLPDLGSLVSLSKLAGPIFFVINGKLICYSAMTLRASNFEMISLATHNIMLRIFFFFCTFGDTFSQAAQSFLPSVMFSKQETQSTEKLDDQSRSVSPEGKKRAQSFLKRLLVLALGMGLVNAQAARIIIQNLGSMFTNDASILSLLCKPVHVLYLMGSVFLHSTIMTMEGSIIATRDLGFLVGAYGVTMALLLSVLKIGCPTFSGVWRGLFLFQITRFCLFGSRILQKTRIRQVSNN